MSGARECRSRGGMPYLLLMARAGVSGMSGPDGASVARMEAYNAGFVAWDDPAHRLFDVPGRPADGRLGLLRRLDEVRGDPTVLAVDLDFDPLCRIALARDRVAEDGHRRARVEGIPERRAIG